MRVAVLLAVLLLTACASEKLALMPPPGIDFSGQWRLNEAESDDPQRLIQNQVGGPGSITPASSDPARRPGGRGPGGGGGPGGQGIPGGPGGAPVGASIPAPAVSALSAGLRWPGRYLVVKQVSGVVAFTSDGRNRVFQPSTSDGKAHHRKPPGEDANRPRDRNMHSAEAGDGPPGICGWDDKTLVVQSGPGEDDRTAFEQRYSVTEDGQRLVELVGFKGRSAGYTMSRVWDRVVADAPPPAPLPPQGLTP